MQKKTKVRDYFSLIAFNHTLFALPFAIIGYFLGLKAERMGFDIIKLLFVLLCMIFARSAAMAFNRYIDREIDKTNPRTATREIPSGIISGTNALIFTIISCAGFMITTFFINKICLFLSPIALSVILGYSFTKRFTALCHLILGLGLSLAPIGAYLAVTGRFDIQPILFSLSVLCWVGGFDIIYALQDENFDKEHGLFSIPSKIGAKNSLLVSTLLHIIVAALLITEGVYTSFGIIYWIGVGIFSLLLIYQHSIIGPTNLKKVNRAFFTTNGVGSVVFAVFVITELLLG